PKCIVDVGTGSGAIAIALAKHLPDVFVTAVDLSSEALTVAEENARRLGVRVRFMQSDLLEAVRGERFDAVVSNPPYVPESDRASLAAEVREYEPELALFAGEMGMSVYERLIPQAHRVLEAGGLLAMEFGFGQREAMAALLRGWKDVRFVEDLQGIPRVAVAVKS
ncbi:MAG TPA: peptide chain release factor N(5)-glutamine methyltransferase, partial [Granulicella sp.]